MIVDVALEGERTDIWPFLGTDRLQPVFLERLLLLELAFGIALLAPFVISVS